MRSLSFFTLALATLFAQVQADMSFAQQIGSQLHPAPAQGNGESLQELFEQFHESQLVKNFAATASNPCSTTLTSTLTIMKTVTLPMPTSSQTAPQSLDMSLNLFIPAITAASEGTVSPSPTTMVQSITTASTPAATLTSLPFLFGANSAASSLGCSGAALSAMVLLSTFLLAL